MKLNHFVPKRFLTGALAVSVAVAAALCPVHATDDMDSMKAQQSDLASQQQQNETALASLRQDKTQKAAYATALQSQLATISAQVNDYNNQITDLDLQSQKAQDKITSTQKQITDDTVKLKQRLCALYMSGGASNLQVLLSSKDVVDLADKAEAVSMVTQHDTDLINRLKAEKATVQQQQASIQQQQAQVKSLKASVDTKQQQLTSSLSETTQFLSQLGQQESDLESQSSTLESKTAKLSAAIDSWQAQQTSNQSASENAATANSSTASQSSANQSSDNGSTAAASNSGSSASASSSSSSSASSSSASFSSVIGKAESALGKPYVMGASGPDAFDCSGLVCWAFGISHTTAQGLYNQSSKISVSERQPGDLIFFTGTYDCGETVTHVGIYIGSNQMIDAEDSGVSIGSTESSYNLQHFYAYGRL